MRIRATHPKRQKAWKIQIVILTRISVALWPAATLRCREPVESETERMIRSATELNATEGNMEPP